MKNSDAPAVRRAAHGDDQKTHFGPVADKPKLLDFRPKEAHGFKHHRPIITRMQASVAERPVALPPVILGRRAMLQNLSKDYLAMERRWLSLAHSYEFSERLSNFTVPFRKREHIERRSRGYVADAACQSY